jgi:hypothetical protein
LLSVYYLLFHVTDSAYQLPHGHELHVLVDNGFNALDKDKDGVISAIEFGSLSFDKEDINRKFFYFKIIKHVYCLKIVYQ